MLRLKPGVKLHDLSPQLCIAIVVAEGLYATTLPTGSTPFMPSVMRVISGSTTFICSVPTWKNLHSTFEKH